MQKNLLLHGLTTQNNIGSQPDTTAQKDFMGRLMNQREMPMMGVVKEIEFAPAELVKRCKNPHDAILLCWELRRVRYMQYQAPELLEMNAGNFSRALNKGPFPNDKREALMRLCGNMAPTQYETMILNTQLVRVDPHEQRIRELETELLQLRASA